MKLKLVDGAKEKGRRGQLACYLNNLNNNFDNNSDRGGNGVVLGPDGLAGKMLLRCSYESPSCFCDDVGCPMRSWLTT